MTFRKRVYAITRLIPKGKVATYGQIARLAGSHKAARAVGLCMKENPYAPRVPCHRVVGSDGSLTGYSGKFGLKGKRTLLVSEGVTFRGEKVDLSHSLWREN